MGAYMRNRIDMHEYYMRMLAWKHDTYEENKRGKLHPKWHAWSQPKIVKSDGNKDPTTKIKDLVLWRRVSSSGKDKGLGIKNHPENQLIQPQTRTAKACWSSLLILIPSFLWPLQAPQILIREKAFRKMQNIQNYYLLHQAGSLIIAV